MQPSAESEEKKPGENSSAAPKETSAKKE